jgi:hypothetical protein
MVEIGARVEVRLDDTRGKRYFGTVESISASDRVVYVTLDNGSKAAVSPSEIFPA